MNLRAIAAFAAAFTLSATAANAGGEHAGGHGENGARFAFGQPGTPGEVDREIRVVMTDNAFDPAVLEIGEGETIRFAIENRGEFLHEFAIGGTELHAAHQDEMMRMLENGMIEADRVVGRMAHDDPNSLLLEPGEAGELIWTFSAPMSIEFACNVPGHYQDGMVGPLAVVHGDGHGHGESS